MGIPDGRKSIHEVLELKRSQVCSRKLTDSVSEEGAQGSYGSLRRNRRGRWTSDQTELCGPFMQGAWSLSKEQ